MIIIGSVEIPFLAGFDVNTRYSDLQGKDILRTKNGTGILTSRWKKLAVSIGGSGWLPEGLDSIDQDAEVDLHNTAWLSTSDAANIITIPRNFRTDSFTPKGQALVGGEMLETSVSIAGSVATLGVIAGAIQYHVLYAPIVTGFIRSVDRSFDETAHQWSWSIDFEEK